MSNAVVNEPNTKDIPTYEERIAALEDSVGMVTGDDVRRLLREEAQELRVALHAERLADAIRAARIRTTLPSWSEINELVKVYCHQYASPHHVTFGVQGMQSLLEKIFEGYDTTTTGRQLWKARIAYYSLGTLKPVHNWAIIEAYSYDNAILNAMQAADQFLGQGIQCSGVSILEVSPIELPLNVTNSFLVPFAKAVTQ